MPDEPVPIRRAAIGCLALAVGGLLVAGLVRPAIFSLAPPRDDSVVIVGTLTDLPDGPNRRTQLLARSYGHDGEREAGDGRVEIAYFLVPTSLGTAAAVNAASPVQESCPVEIGPDRLLDCAGRAWTYEGLPIDSADPPLERFPVAVESGSIVVDFTRTLDG